MQDRIGNSIALSNSTAGESAPMQTVKQPVTLESFDHWEVLKMLLLSDVTGTTADYIYSSHYFDVNL